MRCGAVAAEGGRARSRAERASVRPTALDRHRTAAHRSGGPEVAITTVCLPALQEDPCLRVGMSVNESERYPVLGVLGPLDILGAYV